VQTISTSAIIIKVLSQYSNSANRDHNYGTQSRDMFDIGKHAIECSLICVHQGARVLLSLSDSGSHALCV